METAGSVSVPLRSALNRGPPDLERPVCRSFVEARRFLILSGFAGFYSIIICVVYGYLWLPMVTISGYASRALRACSSSAFVKQCFNATSGELPKSWEASITLPPVLFTTFVIALRRKLWVPFISLRRAGSILPIASLLPGRST